MIAKKPENMRRNYLHRQGNIITLTAFMLPVMFILSAFAINIAYMQLTRTELMVATDAAARAGGRALSELQSVEGAKTAARVTAALNNVAGAPLRIQVDDASNEIEFGSATSTNGGYGRFAFAKKNTQTINSGADVANAIRITGHRSAGSTSGSVELPFPTFGLNPAWNVSSQSVAMQVDRDIAIVLDRSGSMLWKTYNWPRGLSPWNTTIYASAASNGLLIAERNRGSTNYYYAPGVTPEMYQDWVWESHFKLGKPPATPWEDLTIAVNSFLTVLAGTDQAELVSLSSYATTASLDLNLQSDYSQVLSKLTTLSPNGATAIGKGMEAALPSLFSTTHARPLAAKTMIVMTDGMHNEGIDPVTVARNIVRTRNVTIHSVTFSAEADQARMKQVATIGGGKHYHATNGSELVSAFQQIANNLPTIITE